MEQPKRLLSLDVFRGITIAGMILVNNPGDWANIYPALGHAKWHGVTPTDLIFPFFLYIVGVAIYLSLTRRKERGDDTTKLFLQVLRRSALLFLLGLILQGFPYYDLSTIRIPGVLQRIAIVYLFASLIFLKSSIKVTTIFAFGLIILYWILMTFIPVPGVGYASYEPSTNLGAWLDRLVFTTDHLWKAVKTWDPEGLLSSMPAISSALFGVLTGYWLSTKREAAHKLTWMFVMANISMVLGIIWDMWFPINKSIWTSSYVLYANGMALHFLAMCYWFIDVKGYTWWTKPFIVYGVNAITVFFLSGIVARLLTLIKVTGAEGTEITLKTYLYSTFFTPYFSPINASLAWALVYVIIWLGLMWILYAKKIFIKI
jgi:predicted acyltransferase